ncbi:hypothetical protein JYK14_18930 [Siccirubricoccus sp. KC 17139]|uniref:Uncharacterized protein n=1 Tax=Siccirubricoccus soli TaxID=2899147 RepID=A0ABT1D8G1_9PROT|nr:hypothetical protein [Siccirubricoccus soli]MCO6418222.1 hypothetical protein [Siccirubricoccus soli]MCP2684357.1 hypothetical protein [Siccirubricoccus soli]
MAKGFDVQAALARLHRAWSAATSTTWRPEAPALGQCSVTALLLQDRFGGEILQAPTPWGPHFYNRIEGARQDLTAAQFAAMGAAVPPYPDHPASRAEALADTSPAQYAALRQAWDAARERPEE